jgi:hypothetical protein
LLEVLDLAVVGEAQVDRGHHERRPVRETRLCDQHLPAGQRSQEAANELPARRPDDRPLRQDGQALLPRDRDPVRGLIAPLETEAVG